MLRLQQLRAMRRFPVQKVHQIQDRNERGKNREDDEVCCGVAADTNVLTGLSGGCRD